MLRRIVRIFARRWIVALLVLAAVCGLVWFAGPLVAVAGYVPLRSQSARFLVIVVLLLGWGLNNLRLRAADHRSEARLTEGLAANGAQRAEPDAAVDTEQTVLARRLRDALAALRRSGLGRGRRLYRLPWYMLIGSPGSGKTTVVKQSGLRFPLAGQLGDGPVQGSGGTRYCDWWFTDQAVLVDTAGRYTTQDDPRRRETGAWLGFLALLRKSRPKRPLNGVIATVSVADLQERTATQLALQAAAMKRRIQELQNHLGMDLPVYVLVTKCDLIAGFEPFFADLEPDEREQVWGLTFRHSRASRTGEALTGFPQLYEELMARADGRVAARLEAERSARRRALIYEFPRQMLALQPRLYGFLNDVFLPSRFEQPALLRGVFFVSATQTASAGRRLAGVVPGSATPVAPMAAPAAGEARAFFVGRTFRELIFGEAELASANRRTQRRFRWAYIAALSVVFGLFAAAAAAWQVSHTANAGYLRRVEAGIEGFRASTAGGLAAHGDDWEVLARGLNALERLPAGYRDGAEDAPMRLGFGLYQGQKVGAQARRTYLKALRRHFLPALARRLSRALHAATDAGGDERLYEALRFYLMLYRPRHMDVDGLAVWARLLWKRTIPGERYQGVRDDLVHHLKIAVKEGIALPPMDATRVRRARRVLAETPLERRVYRRLKTRYMQKHKGQFSVETVLGSTAEVMFRRRSGRPLDDGVPVLFTYKHFHAGFSGAIRHLAERLGGERWIYGDTGDAAGSQLSEQALNDLQDRVRALYFGEYIRRWRAYLDDLAVHSFHSADRGRAVADMLASSRQPVLQLLRAVRRNTALSRLPTASKTAAKTADAVADETAGSKKRRLERLVPDSVNANAARVPGQPVSDAFVAFNDYVGDEGDARMQQLQEALGGVSDYLDGLAYARDVQQAAFDASRDARGDDSAVAGLRRALAAAPKAVQRWFDTLPANVHRITAVAANGHVNSLWRSKVVPFFDRAIRGRYPVDPDARDDIRLADFSRFFGPDGILDDYFTRYIAPFVDTSGPHWRWRAPVGIPDKALAFFQRVRRIRRAYFHRGGAAAVGFALRPYSLDRAVTHSLLEAAGGEIRYQHGPVRETLFHWPAKGGEAARLVLNLASRGTPVSRRAGGPWGWFRLLDRFGRLAPVDGGDRLMLTFRVDGMTARYELRPASVHHPFGKALLRHFTIPRRL